MELTFAIAPRQLWGGTRWSTWAYGLRWPTIQRFHMKRELNQNLSGNEVYYAVCSRLCKSKDSFSKLHCQKGFHLILFSYKIQNRENAPRGRAGSHTGMPGSFITQLKAQRPCRFCHESQEEEGGMLSLSSFFFLLLSSPELCDTKVYEP